MLQTAILFQDYMVIQRDKKIAVWGTADAGARITVTMQQKTASVAADDCGNWLIFCGPFSTSFQEIMLIASDRDSLVLRNIQVGEVWLAGGQSNMEFHMRYDADLAVEKEICENENIRFFDYPEVSYVGQIDEADYRKNYGFWRTAGSEQLERFSAVGYYFAKELFAKYRVPIGIVGCNWGGTPACAWMSREAIMEGSGQIYLDEYEESVKNLDLTDYEQKFKDDPQSWRVDQLDSPIGDILMFGGSAEEIYEKIAETGIDLSDMDAATMPGMGPKHERRPSGLYESMLKPLIPYTIRGVIWYQGETDGDNHPEVYHTLFPALIRDWRKLWSEELPFLFVQIAPLDFWQDCHGDRYVAIRDAQQHTADTVPGTGMAVISDIGMAFDIHPKKKQPVGHRLALLAENKVYGDDVLCEASTLSEIAVEDGRLVLTFDNVGDGLYLSETVPYGQTVGKERLGGLQVFQNGIELNANRLKAWADGNQVAVLGEDIRSGVQTEVKLAKTGWYLVNLYNSAGIPARPSEISNCVNSQAREEAMKYYLAIDIGASSGRHIVGWRKDGEIVTKEVYRFPNGNKTVDGHLTWDVEWLLSEVKRGIAAAVEEFGVIESLSIDTWGVDYVLLKGDKTVRPCYAYRDERSRAVIGKVHNLIPFSELYRRTGCQFQPFNTVYQLYADKLAGRLEGVTDLLMMPEYLLWKLCGVKAKEYTNATTTGMVNAQTKEFDLHIVDALSLPRTLFPTLQQPGAIIGEYEGIKCVLCATHDTGSAVEGIPMEGNALYISSGTWSLLGVKTLKPITGEASRMDNYSNEGGVGYNRYQKNIMGMWIINRLRDELCPDRSFDVIVLEAQKSHFKHTVDVNHSDFLAPESMKAVFDKHLPHPPKYVDEYFCCAYRSLAISYKKAIEELEHNTGKTYEKLYIVGGGAKNAFLNRLTEEATGKKVVALPIESTALGNLKIQMEVSIC